MTQFVFIPGQVYINPDHAKSVRAYTEKTRFADARNCEFFIPSFETHSVLALGNEMELFSTLTAQEIRSAIAEAKKQAQPTVTGPVSISQHLTVDPGCIVAVFPWEHHFREFVEDEHGYEIYEACDSPRSLIVLDEEICLAVDLAPAELVDKLSKARQG